MQVNTKKTVQDTLDFFPWEDISAWDVSGINKVATRTVYEKKNLKISQVWHPTYRQVLYTTPELTLSVFQGTQTENKSPSGKNYILSVYSTNLEQNVYTSHIGQKGFINETGKPEMLFHFLDKIPDEFFALTQEKHPVARHNTLFKRISSPTKIHLKD